MFRGFGRKSVVCATTILLACNSPDESAFDEADDDRGVLDAAQNVFKWMGEFSAQTMEGLKALTGDNVLARCVHAGDCNASDEEYFAAIAETHEVMRCNSPFRGIYAFAGLSTDAFVKWLKAEGAYLGLDVDALPFKLSGVSKVVIYYGPNIDAGDFVGGAFFLPGNIASNGSSLGWRIDWGQQKVSNLYFWPAVGAGGVTVGGWVDLDWSRAAVVITAKIKSFKIAGQTIGVDGGLIFPFDPKRLFNLFSTENLGKYLRLEPIGDCGPNDSGSDETPGSTDERTCFACVEGGGGKACAEEECNGACVDCINWGGGEACAEKCDGDVCIACVEGGGGKACAEKCSGQCVTCIRGNGGMACAEKCG